MIQNRPMRALLLGVHCFTPVAGVIGELGVDSTIVREMFLYCVFVEPPNCYARWQNHLKDIFRWSLDAQSVWTDEIRQIFNSFDLDANFDSLLPCDIDIDKLRICHLRREAWEQGIVTKPKLRPCRTSKATFATENCVVKRWTGENDRYSVNCVLVFFRC